MYVHVHIKVYLRDGGRNPLTSNILLLFIFGTDKCFKRRVCLGAPEVVREISFIHCTSPAVAHVLQTL